MLQKTVKFGIIGVFGISSLLLIYSMTGVFRANINELTISPGEVYEYSIDSENPFSSPKIKYYRVLDIKNGYTQYLDSIQRDTLSMRTRLFLHGARKIKY